MPIRRSRRGEIARATERHALPDGSGKAVQASPHALGALALALAALTAPPVNPAPSPGGFSPYAEAAPAAFGGPPAHEPGAGGDDGPFGSSWRPPAGFEARDLLHAHARPPKGHAMLYAILSDELFGPEPLTEAANPRVRRAEMVQAFAVNVGGAPWSGVLRLEIPAAGVRHEKEIVDLKPDGLATVLWVGYLRAPDGELAVKASVVERGRPVQTLVKSSTYHAEWPLDFPVGLFVRDLEAPKSWPPWLPGRPFAIGFLNTSPVGNNHMVTCDDAGCEHTYGITYWGPLRTATLAGFARGPMCLTTHVDYWGTAVWPHDAVDDRECLP